MKLAKIRSGLGAYRVVALTNNDTTAQPIDLNRRPGLNSFSDLIHASEPAELARSLMLPDQVPVEKLEFAAPVDRQEIWAAGVTYRRSKVAREEESEGAAQFYDLVYTAERPELFLKATFERVRDPGQEIRVRKDSRWNVPEPELTLVVAPDLRIVGFTIGNDVSSRDIEGANPLYLPQAKVYDGSCSVGPVVTLAEAMPPLSEVNIRLAIERAGAVAYEGETSLKELIRTPESLVEWLARDNHFPHGVLLMTGTGIIPQDEFSLSPGDTVSITIDGIGTLTNPVGQ